MLPGEGGEARGMGLWWACCHVGLRTASCHPQMKTALGGLSDLRHDQTEGRVRPSTHRFQPVAGFRRGALRSFVLSPIPGQRVSASLEFHQEFRLFPSFQLYEAVPASLQSTVTIFCPPVWTAELS